MIFLLANTLACVTFAVLVNINDKRKVTLKKVFSLVKSSQLCRSWNRHELVTAILRTNQYFHFVGLKDCLTVFRTLC